MKIRDIFRPNTWRIFTASTLALLPLSIMASTARIEPGHSAIWTDPGYTSEGWVLEILPDDTAALYWYTFDDAGKPRWITAVAPIIRGEDGDKIVFDELIAGRGGRFGTNYPASSVILEDVGTAELSFTDCNRGGISFTAYGKTRTFPLSRLTRTMGAGCAPIHGVPGEQIQSYAGTSGTWIDPAKAGQTFTLQWQADGSAVLNWFTFDANGKPFWISGTGEVEDGRIVFPQMESVQGGRFGEHDSPLVARFDARRTLRGEQIDPPEPVVKVPWGRVELELTCDNGTATYQATAAGFGSGSFNLLPMTDLAKPACPWVKPKLTDLYDITLIELPDEPVGPTYPGYPGSDNLIFASTVADTGAVAGSRRRLIVGGLSITKYQLALWKPGDLSWTTPMYNHDDIGGAYISPSGDSVIASLKTGMAPTYVKYVPAFFTESEFTPFPGLIYDTTNRAYAVSHDFSHVVGASLRTVTFPDGYTGWLDVPWIWSEQDGQVALPFFDIPIDLPLTPDTALSIDTTAVSNDGRTVIGKQIQAAEDPWFPQALLGVDFAVRWFDRQPPHRLSGPNGEYLGWASACSANCEYVFGNRSWAHMDDDGILRDASFEAWYWKRNGESGSLGAPNNTATPTRSNPLGWNFGLSAVSAEGGMLVGWYQSHEMEAQPPSIFGSAGALIWTQDTGYVMVSELLEELGQSLNWPTMAAVDISSNGSYILLATGEIRTGGSGTPSSTHSALLHLTPKAQVNDLRGVEELGLVPAGKIVNPRQHDFSSRPSPNTRLTFSRNTAEIYPPYQGAFKHVPYPSKGVIRYEASE